MSDRIEVTWQVADGYAGKSRPQHTTIPIDDILECDLEEEVKALIEECIQDDFQNRIFASYGEDVYEKALRLFAEKGGGNE